MESETISRFLEAVVLSDRARANEIIDEWAASHSYEAAIMEIVDPVMDQIGERWVDSNGITFAQVYVSAKITEDILLKALSERGATKNAINGTIIIGNIEDDFHSLGRKLLGTFLTAAGWRIVDLGNDVLADEFLEAAIREKAQIIAASAMMHTTALNIAKLRKAIDDAGLKGKIMLAVGGAIFNMRPELLEVVGADGSARNALAAGRCMEDLVSRIDTEVNR